MGDSATDQATVAGSAPAKAGERPPAPRAWFAGWLAASAGATGAMVLSFPDIAWPVIPALMAMALPSAVGLLLRRMPSARVSVALLVLWALGGGGACALTGGVAGPLAAWCLAPVALAAALGGGRRFAEGGVLALVAAAIAALAGVLGVTPPPPVGEAATWLGLLSLSTAGLGLGAGLILSERRAQRRQSRRDDELGRLRAILDEQPCLVLSLYTHGRVRAMYGRAPEGVPPTVLAAQGLAATAVAGRDRAGVVEALRRAATEGEAEVGYAPIQAMDRWVSVHLRRVEENVILAVLRDATGERAREVSLEQARQDAETLAAGKSRFLANMSHELRTPLNAIMGFSDIMRTGMFGPLPDKYAEYSELIHESGSHLLDLINDVLDMSKIEAERYELSREPFDAREAVSAALRLMRLQADGAGVQLRGVLPPRPLEVDADRRAIKQIVLNLVSNALKFTPKGGAVTVTAQGYDGVFELVVADTGTGISEEDLARLGKPFEQAGDRTRRNQGTGLGLSLVRSFAELHGGEMTLESTLGEGTSVTVRLPVLLTPEHETPPPMGDNVIAFNPQR